MTGAGVSAESERASLIEFLDYQRGALIKKVVGVSEEDARRAPTASSLTLLGLVKHSAIWERRWFQVVVAGRGIPGEWPERTDEEDETFHLADDETIESVVGDYLQQIAAANDVLSTFDLDAPCALSEIAPHDLRWVAMHLVEETARHAGHADIIRETIDGSRGV